MTASVLRSSADRVWTAERFDLKAEGKAEGLDSETIVCGMISDGMLGLPSFDQRHLLNPRAIRIPLFRAPQTLQCRIAFSSPVDSRSRLPQSVQKIKDPMADILGVGNQA